MEQLFAGYLCAIIVDDIIIGGCNATEHNANLKKVLDWAREEKPQAEPSQMQVPHGPGLLCGSHIYKGGPRSRPEDSGDHSDSLAW